MRRRGIALAAAAASLAVVLAGGRARAQSFSRLEPEQRTVTLETGLQDAVVTSVGVAVGVRVPALNRTVMPFLQGTFMLARPDLGDWGSRGGAQVSLFELGGLDVSTQLAAEVDATSNSVYAATALRSDVVLLAGHYARRWFVAGEAGWDHAWLTHIKPTDWYRTYFYAGARDGWYGGTGGNLRGGLKGGVTLGRVEVVLRAGFNRTEGGRELDLPFYGVVGAGWRW